MWALTLLLLTSAQSLGEDVQVFIEEEHHEVILHWISALERKGWPKADLIHIDGHSDMDYPELVNSLPVGHVPNSPSQISAMMQRNDQFIQAAIVGNLIRSVYIILPTWTSNESVAFNASIGKTSKNFTNRHQLCLCFTDQNSNKNETCQTRSLGSEDTELQILPHLCTPRISSYRHVELNSYTAVRGTLQRMLQKQDPATLIIDIDEDFFGVQLPASSLLQNDCDLIDLFEISNTFHSIFCPPVSMTGAEELEIDSWFQQTIKSFAMAGCFSPTVCLDMYYNSSLPICCRNKALKAISETGICLEAASRTFQTKPKIGLCLGHNLPGASVVPEFVPSYKNIVGLARNMTRILNATLARRPIVITIARSSRDGYVVRKLQPMIELAIKMVLKRVFNLTDANFHYSDYLAGGKIGWVDRYRETIKI
ncbi:hypothetical protein EGR_03746 [Echinococcus granulosus]|uniref:Uncharacterized protein n=1 Tax=Echinococcus granulosus TaxID=6210 RepID=W6UK05_ECHGR|nr:hypothetical protein EGR_03746 [Echinococcus granulosus]EUB61456.1 hypothetical protein EGR_03746 [Echinococcus granulosus]